MAAAPVEERARSIHHMKEFLKSLPTIHCRVAQQRVYFRDQNSGAFQASYGVRM